MFDNYKKLIKKIYYFFVTIFFILLSFNVVFADTCVTTSGKDGNFGLDTTAKCSGFETDSTKTDVATVVGRLVGYVLQFLGIIFMILIIYGGFLWMTARGNDQKTEEAKGIIIHATIGVIVVFSAYAISSFIITQLANATAKTQ